jgi:hypothetical protein
MPRTGEAPFVLCKCRHHRVFTLADLIEMALSQRLLEAWIGTSTVLLRLVLYI